MGTTDNATFANALGHFYQNLAQQVGDYLHTNIQTLSNSDMDLISQDQIRLTSYATTFFSLSDSIAFEGSDAIFAGVSNATGTINAALKKINDTNKVINIAAGCITLAASIASKNGDAVKTSLQSILSAIKS
jgi:hypothetical protein